MIVGIKQLQRESGYPPPTLERLIHDAPVEPDVVLGGKDVRGWGDEKRFAVCVAAHVQRANGTATAQRKVARFLAKTNLEKRIAKGECYLVVHFDQVFLCREDAVLTAQGGKTPAAAFIIVDLAKALETFKRKSGAPVNGNSGAQADEKEVAHASV
jgi:hypothetical protein